MKVQALININNNNSVSYLTTHRAVAKSLMKKSFLFLTINAVSLTQYCILFHFQSEKCYKSHEINMV